MASSFGAVGKSESDFFGKVRWASFLLPCTCIASDAVTITLSSMKLPNELHRPSGIHMYILQDRPYLTVVPCVVHQVPPCAEKMFSFKTTAFTGLVRRNAQSKCIIQMHKCHRSSLVLRCGWLV
jgi:hypothetical protein